MEKPGKKNEIITGQMKDDHIISLKKIEALENELHKTQELLKESEKKYTELFEKSGDAILIIENGFFIDCNKATVDILNYKSKEEFLNVHPSKLSPEYQPDGRLSVEKADEILDMTYKKGTHRFEWDHMKSNGEVFPVEVLLTAISTNPDNRLIHTVWRDITERKKAEKKQIAFYNISRFAHEANHLGNFLKKVHIELSSLINTENFYVALYHKEIDKYSFVYHVDAYDDFNDPEELFDIKKSLTDYTRKIAKPILVDKAFDKKLREAGEVSLIGEPSAIWLGAPLIDNQGNSIGVISVQNYDSPLAYTNEDLNLLNFVAQNIGSLIGKINYEQTLKKSYESLKIAKRKAEESDRFKSAFLANMSHEIRTPMNGIIGFAELLNQENLSEEKRKFFIKTINSNCNQLLNIVNDIIDISKIETGQIDIQKKEVNLNELLEEIISVHMHNAHQKSIDLKLTKDISDKKSIIYTDKVKLRQILDNLLSNAIKFTHEGFIHLGYTIKKEELEFYVKDTGIGMTIEEQKIIFGRFNQAKLDIAMKYGGTGLGLSIAKAYIEKLGGKIWLESKEGEGTTFHFDLPFQTLHKKTESDLINKETKPQLNHFKILTVEDDENNFILIKELLSNINAEVIHAKTGSEAIRIFRDDFSINLVLMDIKLPDIDGFEVTKEFKLIRNSIPIIAQSAFALQSDKEKALKAGCIDYITKPIIGDELLDKIYQFAK